jgi:hypothetical protein
VPRRTFLYSKVVYPWRSPGVALSMTEVCKNALII